MITGIRRRLRADGRSGMPRLGIEFRRDAIDIAMREGNRVDVQHCDVGGPSGWASRLQDFVQERGLRGAAAVAVLQSSQYQLTRVERPRVEDAEMRQAVRWTLRDYEASLVEDAEIQIFEEPATVSEPPSIYVALAPRAGLMGLANAIQSAGLKLDAIRIPELMLARCVAQLPGEANALVWLRAEELRMAVCWQGSYCAGRCIPIRLQASDGDSLPPLATALEAARESMQALLDYSMRRYAVPEIKLWYAAEPGAPSEIAETLTQDIGSQAPGRLPMTKLIGIRAPIQHVSFGLPAAAATLEAAHA